MKENKDANYIWNLIKNSFEFGCTVFFKILFLVLAYLTYPIFNFIKDSFSSWLIIQVGLTIITVILYFTLVFIHHKLYRKFIKTLESVLDFTGALTLLIIFPFDFSSINISSLNTIARIVLILIVVGSGIGIIVNSVQLVLKTINFKSEEEKEN